MDTRLWPSATPTVDEANEFALKTRKMTKNPMAISASPDERGDCRSLRPAEPMIEPREDDERDEAERHEDHDQPLRRLRLRGRPSLDAALQESGVIGDQELGNERRRGEKNGEKCPTLPEPRIAGRPEDERAHDERERDEPNPRYRARSHRRSPLLASV